MFPWSPCTMGGGGLFESNYFPASVHTVQFESELDSNTPSPVLIHIFTHIYAYRHTGIHYGNCTKHASHWASSCRALKKFTSCGFRMNLSAGVKKLHKDPFAQGALCRPSEWAEKGQKWTREQSASVQQSRERIPGVFFQVFFYVRVQIRPFLFHSVQIKVLKVNEKPVWRSKGILTVQVIWQCNFFLFMHAENLKLPWNHCWATFPKTLFWQILFRCKTQEKTVVSQVNAHGNSNQRKREGNQDKYTYEHGGGQLQSNKPSVNFSLMPFKHISSASMEKQWKLTETRKWPSSRFEGNAGPNCSGNNLLRIRTKSENTRNNILLSSSHGCTLLLLPGVMAWPSSGIFGSPQLQWSTTWCW